MSAPLAFAQQRREREQIRRLGIVSLLEASTLILLLFVAVPLKHLAGWPAAVAIVGPVHGLAFLLSCGSLSRRRPEESAAGERWRGSS